MDNNTAGARKLFLKPAKTGLQKSKSDQNGTASTSSSENGNSSSNFSPNNNPFLKCDKEKDDDAEKTADSKERDPAVDSKDSKDKIAEDLFKPAKTNLFTNATTLSENSNFVFGQNLHERVIVDKTNASSVNNENEKESSSKSDGLLFSSVLISQTPSSTSISNKIPSSSSSSSQDAVNLEQSGSDNCVLTQPIPLTTTKKSEKDTDEVISQTTSNDNNNISLVEAARRYEEMKGAQKRKYEEVEVITGEEDEKNVLEISCKLFTFDKNNWEERGRGFLRLNDCKNSASRVVIRASGSFRLLLNTKVWKDQLCEQPSSKSLRLTAFDTSGLLKIYLVMGRNEDIDNLYHALSTRIRREKDRTPEQEEEANDITDEDDSNNEPVTKKLVTNVE